jgi:inner membrane protein
MQTPSLPSRSLGLKFLLVCFLVMMMSIPAYAVYLVLGDREQRAREVVEEVGARFGGEQSALGPILIAPYRVVVQPTATWQVGAPGAAPQPVPQPQIHTGWYVVSADTGEAAVIANVAVRSRGDLFKVRTYTADLSFTANFDLTREPSSAPTGAEIDWSKAAVLVGVADARGLQGRAAIQIDGRSIALEPAPAYARSLQTYLQTATDARGSHSVDGGRLMEWLVADIGDVARPGAALRVTARLSATGVESLSLGAFADNTDIRIQGNWSDVGYFGRFAAQPREMEQGFDATWSIPYAARGVASAGGVEILSGIAGANARVSFIDPASPYQWVSRALKYPVLFIGVVFLAYFLFEAKGDQRVHPAQYILVGLAQVVFYLLLLSIAERLGFDWAFLIAALATVALIAYYLGSIFKSVARGMGGLVVFSMLYGLIYALLRSEDYSLLAGSVAAFAAIAAIMMLTRNLDWYGLGREAKVAKPEAPPSP